MTQISKETCKVIREEVNAAMKVIAEKHGFDELKIGRNIRYDNSALSFKVEGIISGGENKEEKAYQANAHVYGLPELGSKIEIPGSGTFILSGWNTRARKNKILITRVNDGKGFNTCIDHIRSLVK